MNKKIIFLWTTFAICSIIAIAFVVRKTNGEKAEPLQHTRRSIQRRIKATKQPLPTKKMPLQKPLEKPKDSFISGTLRDTDGNPMPGVIVSNGIECILTDSLGAYKLKKDDAARFVFYSVPADCEIPTHSANDNTALFYQPIVKGKQLYNFTLKRLTGGIEHNYKMIVIGDPQITNAFNPYYNTPDDNPVKMSDIERFTTETMVDIKQTIRELPQNMPIYGLSMGDDVQYYGGYNHMLERQIREALGSSKMRLFSVIGNHDQDGNKEYLHKWEENWRPTDYSFNRGNEHYVCLNNVQFYSNKAYYSPGELTDRQMTWLQQDLNLTDKNKKIILCYHIPLTFGNNPFHLAQPLGITSEKGHYLSSRLTTLLQILNKFHGGYELFCGHTHFAINHEIEHNGEHIIEHCHAAACGNIWQSNINICGTPNGYYVYEFNGTHITDCYYKGTFWEKQKQMTLFLADEDFNGESYGFDWGLPRKKGVIIANVFNADSRWRIYAEENGKEYAMHRISAKGQDAFATGYHHKYAIATSFQFISKRNNYLIMNHLYYYEPKAENADIKIIAQDPYGHTYTTSTKDIIREPYHNFAHYYEEETK